MSRADRLAELIRLEVADILHRKVSDPRLRYCSITQVVLTPDLKFAKIYVSSIEVKSPKEDVQKGLSAASRFIRRELGGRLETRTVPAISFLYDESLKAGDNVLAIMSKIEQEREADDQDA